MGDKKNKKKTSKKPLVVDTTIIEHLACLEINSIILQPPFHLVSNIQWNDKGISFDGNIEVFRNYEIKKGNFINNVPVQVKGTTIQKAILRKNKISYSVKKADLEVYYKHGRGVLYFVVTINPTTYTRQAYYKIFTPLELKGILSKLDKNGNDSIATHFKILERGRLEAICRTFLNEVDRQPKHYIETSQDKEYKYYKVNFIDLDGTSFDIFEEAAYLYGVTTDDIEMPVEIVKVASMQKKEVEVVHLNGEDTNIVYHLTETEKNYKIIIENTLVIEVNKKNNTGKLHLGKLKKINTYLKCLQLISYYKEHKKLPFQSLELKVKTFEMKNFEEIEEEINSYIELSDICRQIGISENYVFNEKEDLPSLFNFIIEIFKNKRYELLNIPEGILEDTRVIKVELSKYVNLKLMYSNGEFTNFYSEKVLKEIGGLVPKEQMTDSKEKDEKSQTNDKLPDNWGDFYYRVSIHSSEKLADMKKDINFNLDVVKLSFADEYHDIQYPLTINQSLDYIYYYFETQEVEYLDLALQLNKRYIEKNSDDDYAKINIYLIKLMKHQELLETEQQDILDIQERASHDRSLNFACEALLKNKLKAERIFNSIEVDERERVTTYPIYTFYKTL